MSMTLAQKKSLLVKYLAAEEAVLRGQEYTIKDRSLTRADLRWIQNGRAALEKEIATMGNSGIVTKRILYRDD